MHCAVKEINRVCFPSLFMNSAVMIFLVETGVVATKGGDKLPNSSLGVSISDGSKNSFNSIT
jgi:hypothetical protein